MPVTISLRTAKVVAALIDLLPVKHMEPETQRAVIQFLAQIRKAEHERQGLEIHRLRR